MAGAGWRMSALRIGGIGTGRIGARPATGIALPDGTTVARQRERQYLRSPENPHGYCPNHQTGVTLPDDFVVTPLQYVD